MFEVSQRADHLVQSMSRFMEEEVYPAEVTFEEQCRERAESHEQPPILEHLKARAREAGLWNLFLPHAEAGHDPLRNVEYAPIAELSGRSINLAPEAMNCSAPDTGNMELLSLFGTPEQKERWLRPLMDGLARSSYAMTEPLVASSDASNIQTTVTRRGDEWVLSGRKWWITGALRERNTLLMVMGITDPTGDAPRHQRHSIILVPRETPGITIERELSFMGHLPFESHVEMTLDDVRVPVANILGKPGAGFAMSQARLGPGRIHHCMRLVGAAERALELMIARARARTTFGVDLIDQGVIREWIAESRIAIDQARLYTLYTAYLMDTVGNKAAASEISGIKVAVPKMALDVLDRAMRVFGAGGFSGDYVLFSLYAEARKISIADGPDEVHKRAVARTELRRFDGLMAPRPSGAAAHLAHVKRL